ncbi:MAG: hypothetical protein VX589_09910 [Myxococcota bacterium]|nr:hypothetical protein [Myxococcota bacterium]
MKTRSPMKSTIDDRPFLFIGAVEAQHARRFRCILDVMMAQPSRWHSAWPGRAVYGIALTPASHSCDVIQEWARERSLPTHALGIGQTRISEVNAWGALLVGREKNSLRFAQACIDSGVPVITVDFDSLETIEVTRVELEEWLFAAEHNQQTTTLPEIIGFSTNDEQFKDDKSPFLVNSVTLPRDNHTDSSLAARNGERCGFSRSQAEKVG